MRLAALTAGAGVPSADFAASVERIYARVCVLSVTDGTLVTLVTSEIGSLPSAITVEAPRQFTFRGVLSVGAEVAGRAKLLRVAGSALSIDLRPSRPWRCDLGSLKLDLGRRSVRRAWEAAWSVLRDDGRSDGFLRIAGPATEALVRSTQALDIVSGDKTMARLIGFGEGATPAGDDFLVGYLAGLWSSIDGIEARATFVSELGKRLTRLSSRTSRVSRLYLNAAATGQVSERLATLSAGIAAGSEKCEIGAAASAALAVGHSSGACGLLGLLLGCRAWDPAS